MEGVLQEIRDFADRAHGTQLRKYSPDRYIVHPVRVMEICRRHTDDLPVLAAALLHDVLEDTPVTKNELHGFLATLMKEEDTVKTMQLVVELTDVYTKVVYPRWNRRKRKTKEAERIRKTSGESQTVKYADIIDNCREIVQHDPDFAQVFLRECRGLLRVMPKGNEVLYREAVDTVDNCLRQVKLDDRQ
ncbi:MAG TPA: HD domain-containing protein [Flavisolibacter sp.]|jgi:(p)ppGpp synthase/HD superfamily hydrolase|nr:HD domain-containing protein [Flavisolibacter sp.]